MPSFVLLHQNTTITLTLQVRLKSIKICAQQSMSNHFQCGNLQMQTDRPKYGVLLVFTNIYLLYGLTVKSLHKNY